MAKELNEYTAFNVSIKTLIGIGAVMATVISMWFVLQSEIEEAKKLPEPPAPVITRMEFDMKDQLVRQTIMTTQEDVKEIKVALEKLENKYKAKLITTEKDHLRINSFIRKRYPHILEDKDILYVEHNILDWYEDEVKKLGNFDYIPENDYNNYNVVVKTPNYFAWNQAS